MRTQSILLGAAGLCLTLTALAAAPRAVGAASPDLQEQLAQAFARNPDILSAEAKVRQAEAELRAVRLRVTEELIGARTKLEQQVHAIRSVEAMYARSKQLAASGMTSSEEVLELEVELAIARGELTRLEARMAYLLGSEPQGAGSPGTTAGRAGAATAPGSGPGRPAAPEALESFLRRLIPAVSFEDAPLDAVLAFLHERSGASFLVQRDALAGEWDTPDEPLISIALGQADLRSALLALADLHPPLAFVVRDYGVLVTTRFDAENYFAESIPDVPLSVLARPHAERR